jgi:hypothetical protein
MHAACRLATAADCGARPNRGIRYGHIAPPYLLARPSMEGLRGQLADAVQSAAYRSCPLLVARGWHDPVRMTMPALGGDGS